MLTLRPQGWASGLVAVTAAIICGCGSTGKQPVADSPVLTPPREPLTSKTPGSDVEDRTGGQDRDRRRERQDHVRTVSYLDEGDLDDGGESRGLLAPPSKVQDQHSGDADETSGEDVDVRPPDTAERAAQESMPIDLPTALQLAGGNHLQIALARERIQEAAAEALPLNFNGIRDRQLRPIEAQQAITALASARSLYLASVIDYNRAQLELLRAIGEPPSAGTVPVDPDVPTFPSDTDSKPGPRQPTEFDQPR